MSRRGVRSSSWRSSRTLRKATLLFAVLLVPVLCMAQQNVVLSPALANPNPEARVSFAFDDGLSSALTKAAPVLNRYGFRATDYVITGCVGTTGICAANESASYMTWDQIQQLRTRYGWEIGSHTVSHPALGGLSIARQEHELSKSKNQLAQHGITATSLASPYGDYSNQTLALAAKYYQSHRGFWDNGSNRWPYNEYLLTVQQIQSGVSVTQVRKHIDRAIRSKQWLILVFHEIKTNPSPNPNAFEYSPKQLGQIAAYLHQRDVTVTNVSEGVVSSNINLLSNGSFEKGLNGGWSTDTPQHVTLDTHNNGSFPSPRSSILLTVGDTPTHLFSPKLDVDSHTTYMLKSFLNVTAIAKNQVGYYIDEFDDSGKWLSGQWRLSENDAFVEAINFTYKPSSTKVKQARLQVYVTPGAGTKAYVDNFQWWPMKH